MVRIWFKLIQKLYLLLIIDWDINKRRDDHMTYSIDQTVYLTAGK